MPRPAAFQLSRPPRRANMEVEALGMSRLIRSVLRRDQVIERLTAHPLTLALGAAMLFAQAAVCVGEVAGVPFGRWFALLAHDIEPGALLFPLSHYAPVSDAHIGGGFAPLDFVFSMVLFSLCGLTLLTCGPVVENYYGTRRTFGLLVLTTAGHAGAALAMRDGAAFSLIAFCGLLLTTCLLVQFDRRDTSEGDADARVLGLVAAFAVSCLGAGFLPHPAYDSLPAAAGVGPVLGLAAFALHRRMQMRAVRLRGEGKVGDLYFVDELDLLTRDELQERTDTLLAKIGSQGLDALSPEERRFLKRASERLKASHR